MNLYFPAPFLCFLPYSLPFSVSLSPSLLVSGSIYLESFTFKEEHPSVLLCWLLVCSLLAAWSPAAAFEIALCRSGQSCSFCLVLLGGFSSSPLSTISRLNTVSAAILEEFSQAANTSSRFQFAECLVCYCRRRRGPCWCVCAFRPLFC